jgi:hypothetical protein
VPDRDAARAGSAESSIRRIAAAAVTLAIIDVFVPGWVARAERSRYEGGHPFRFEYSDLFAIGPVVAYLRDHPRGDRPRAVFLGNSVVWGYRLPPEDSVPARFQGLEPSVRVFNLAVNGFGIVSAYLMLKDVIDSIDTVYVHVGGREVNAGLARLIPVADEDVSRFGLDAADRVEESLERGLGFWRLYRYSYRLQAAVFGTSARNYVYAHKAALVGGSADAGRTPDYAPNPPAAQPLRFVHRVAATEPTPERRRALAEADPGLWECAAVVRAHGKHAVFWTAEDSGASTAWDEWNRVFLGSAAFVRIVVPADMLIDERHLTSNGSAAVAALLHELTRDAFASPNAVH